MRSIKKLGLVTPLVVLVLSFAAAGSASAVTHIVFCEVSNKTLCPAGKALTPGKLIVGVDLNTKVEGNGLENVCYSELTGKFLNQYADPQEWFIESSTINSCSEECWPWVNPGTAKFKMTEGGYKMILSAARIKLECKTFTCIYEGEVEFELEKPSGGAPIAVLKEAFLPYVEGDPFSCEKKSQMGSQL